MIQYLYCSSRKRQGGQILPVAAVGFVVMCAIAGLAIDASRDYLAKRDAQNAADFAVLAAGKQMTFSNSLSSPVIPNSNPIIAAHDYAALNGFPTIYNNACDTVSTNSFNTSWFDVSGLSCSATTGFTNKISINSPPVDLPGTPVPQACIAAGADSCFQVVITTRINEFFTGVLGIPFAYVTVGATAQASLPASTIDSPPPDALLLYQPQTECPAGNQCFNEGSAVAKANLACSNCPTVWVRPGTSPKIYGFDGAVLNSPSDLTTIRSAGDMVVQDRTTICDPYRGATCVPNTAVGAAGFAVPAGANLYCSKIGGGGSSTTPCTTTGQTSLNEIDGKQTGALSPVYWSPEVDTTKLKDCGSLILNGGMISGPCANSQEPYLIEPGIYDYIVINHGTYEFDQGLFDITGLAPVNTNTGANYIANGIDHSRETATDFDLCTGGAPNSCPELTAGVWIGHGQGYFGALTGGTGTCLGGTGSSSGGGGDPTIVSGSGTTFILETAGFVSTHEVTSISLAGSAPGALASVNGSPLLFDEENNSFIHLDATPSVSSNTFQGIIYQTAKAKAGGVEINLGMNGQAALLGQVVAYSFTTFGTPGTMDFRQAYGTGGVSGISTSGRNETSIVSSVTLAATPGRANYSTLTVNYTDEWAMDATDIYVKVNNGSPTFFSQGIWSPTPAPGDPVPPPLNNPGDQYPAYPNTANHGLYTIVAPNDWSFAIPNTNGETIEAKGSWTWGHHKDILGAVSGAYTAQILYTFPNPNGNYVAITVFAIDGDRCGDYDIASYSFKNTGLPGGGQQTVGSVVLVQ